MTKTSVQEYYNKNHDQYKKRDRGFLENSDHSFFVDLFSEVENTLSSNYTALEIGCGCGRNFHLLKQCKKLIGLDVSEELLEEAKSPIGNVSSAMDIELHFVNIYDKNPFPEKVDFIFSIGTLSHVTALSNFILRKIKGSLNNNGKLLFSYHNEPISMLQSYSKRLKLEFRKFLSTKVEDHMAIEWQRHRIHDEKKLVKLLQKNGFAVLNQSKHPSKPWKFILAGS